MLWTSCWVDSRRRVGVPARASGLYGQEARGGMFSQVAGSMDSGWWLWYSWETPISNCVYTIAKVCKWSELAEITLVEEVHARYNVLFGAFSTTVTNVLKTQKYQ